ELYNRYSYETKLKDKLPIKISIDNMYIAIDKDNLKNLDLPNKLVSLGLDSELTLPTLSKDIYLRLGLNPSFYADSYDFSPSDFRIPLRAYFIHLLSQKLKLIYGFAVYPDFDKEVFPIGGVIYEPNSKISFELIPSRPNITYNLTQNLSLLLEAGLSNYEFEVERQKREGVVLSYREMRLAGGIKFKLNKWENFLSVGDIFRRRFEYRDSQEKLKIKDTFYIEYRTKFSF
ncbi:MAG: DUF6268 family outer membrane beta-barrel protein, partial [Candidatus Omnitrophica bacterium]|nr:DUF6268 family outer membrane beta-barrel protein [Candidatus Omnitrophota bacterium]